MSTGPCFLIVFFWFVVLLTPSGNFTPWILGTRDVVCIITIYFDFILSMSMVRLVCCIATIVTVLIHKYILNNQDVSNLPAVLS